MRREKTPTKITWSVTFRNKWILVMKSLWIACYPGVPLEEFNLDPNQWDLLYSIFKTEFEAQCNETLKKTCSKSTKRMKAMLLKFDDFFKGSPCIEKLFKKTRELLGHQAPMTLTEEEVLSNAIKNTQFDHSDITNETFLETPTVLVEYNTGNVHKTGQRKRKVQSVNSDDEEDEDKDDENLYDNVEILRAAKLIENCLDMNTEQDIVEKFGLLVQNEKFGKLKPDQAIHLLDMHLRDMEDDIQEKRRSLANLKRNWKKRRMGVHLSTVPPVSSVQGQQQPVVHLHEVMGVMFQMFSTFQQQQEQVTRLELQQASSSSLNVSKNIQEKATE